MKLEAHSSTGIDVRSIKYQSVCHHIAKDDFATPKKNLSKGKSFADSMGKVSKSVAHIHIHI